MQYQEREYTQVFETLVSHGAGQFPKFNERSAEFLIPRAHYLHITKNKTYINEVYSHKLLQFSDFVFVYPKVTPTSYFIRPNIEYFEKFEIYMWCHENLTSKFSLTVLNCIKDRSGQFRTTGAPVLSTESIEDAASFKLRWC